MRSKIKMGVLGGIGPDATAEFYSILIDKLQKSGVVRSNRDFPQIVINSIPAPELIYEKITEQDLQPYIEGLRELDRFGVDFIVMVCNTIHLYYDELQSKIGTPILDMRKEVGKMLAEKGIKSVLILGTANTVRQGLYRFEGIVNFEPNEEELDILARAIFNFNRGGQKEKSANIIREICKKYLDAGAEAVVLGCTELAVMIGGKDMQKINTVDVLAEAAARRIGSF